MRLIFFFLFFFTLYICIYGERGSLAAGPPHVYLYDIHGGECTLYIEWSGEGVTCGKMQSDTHAGDEAIFRVWTRASTRRVAGPVTIRGLDGG